MNDELLHLGVTLKVVKKDAGLDASASLNLLQAAGASSALTHSNSCTVHEVGETDGELYIVMELVEGKMSPVAGDSRITYRPGHCRRIIFLISELGRSDLGSPGNL